ncbi:MAG: 50S ribosome-binding GTPase [Candidatus Margulisbacteria bacterium]|jgi:ferrous iron transport protein B|nr:50S ribosome-binding GTPase [Candidatus Margulisiibacteriota bacterium]
MKTILILGQTFSGKTNIFNNLAASSRRQTPYPGSQIKLNIGQVKLGGQKYRLLEAPGIHTLIPTSENETIALNLILKLQPEKIIFTLNEKTLENSVLILIQLAELNIPFIVNYQVQNIADQEYFFDQAKLTHIFNAPVIISAPTHEPRRSEIQKALAAAHKPRWVGSYSKTIEKILQDFSEQFKFSGLPEQRISWRFIGLMLLLGNKNIYHWIRRSYPPAVREKILAYAAEKYAIAHSFTIANRWESLSRSLCPEIWQKEQRRGARFSHFFEEYSLRFFWDLLIAAVAIFLIFAFVHFVGNRLLVYLFYDELFGKYLAPFITYIFVSVFGNNLFTDFFVGQYGLLTTGIAYAFTILLPIIGSFLLIYAFLENTGYINRLGLTCHRLLRLFGLNGNSLPSLLFSCCKIAALNKSAYLGTRREQNIQLLLFIFFIPCVSQLVIISNLLAIIQFQHALIFGGIMLLQAGIILGLHSLLRTQPPVNYSVKITPLHFPDGGKILATAGAYLYWYMRSITPLILGASAFLFVAHSTGLLELFRVWTAPLIQTFLNLPEAFTDSVTLGLFRKDLGAISLYDLANNGMLNSIQVLVSLLFISLSLPCLGFLGELARQKGWFKALLIFFLSTIYAFTIAAIVNKILHI